MVESAHIDEAALEEALRQQESLLAFIASISSELELQPLLTLILRHACELIGADVGTIGLFDEKRRVVRTEAVYNMPPGELGVELPEGVGLAGEVVRRGEPVLMDRYGDLPHPTQPTLSENTILGMPILDDGRLIGVFGVGAYPLRVLTTTERGVDRTAGVQRKRFRDADVELLGIFARHVAIAIANARRYERAHGRQERLALIARIARIVTSELRLGEALQRAADAMHELLGYPNIAIPLVDRDDPNTLVLRTVGGHYKDIIKGEYRIPITQGLMGAAVRERQTILVNDVASDPRHLPTPGAVGITAELAVPILLGDRVLGVLNVESGTEFTEDDATSVRIVADQLAIAIENTRLYGDASRLAIVEERQRVARELHDSVTQHLVGMVLIGESLAPAYRREQDEGTRRVDRILSLGHAALAEMRALVAELRPSDASTPAVPGPSQPTSIVRSEGLIAALEQHIDEHKAELPDVSLQVTDYEPRAPHVEEMLFRIVQEALNNIAKHARAKNADVVVRSAGDGTHIRVDDDGVGFDTRRRGRRTGGGGLGLSIMRERAESVGGSLEIATAPGKGTSLFVHVPPEDR